MMQKILQEMEQIAKSAKGGSEKETLEAIRSARESIRGLGGTVEVQFIAPLQELDKELSVWQSKLSVIWKEIVGRQGIVKHAAHWAEKLRGQWQTK